MCDLHPWSLVFLGLNYVSPLVSIGMQSSAAVLSDDFLKFVSGPVSCKSGGLLLQCTKSKTLSTCFHCSQPFSEKKNPCFTLNGGKIACSEHLVHDYCGPCGCSALNPVLPAIPVFGFDVGGVLVPGASSGDEDTLLGNNVSKVVASDGAFELIAKLIAKYGPERFRFYRYFI